MYKNELPSGFITQKLLDFYGIGINTAFIDKSIFGTGKFFKEQTMSEKQSIYEEIDSAIKKAPEEEK